MPSTQSPACWAPHHHFTAFGEDTDKSARDGENEEPANNCNKGCMSKVLFALVLTQNSVELSGCDLLQTELRRTRFPHWFECVRLLTMCSAMSVLLCCRIGRWREDGKKWGRWQDQRQVWEWRAGRREAKGDEGNKGRENKGRGTREDTEGRHGVSICDAMKKCCWRSRAKWHG